MECKPIVPIDFVGRGLKTFQERFTSAIINKSYAQVNKNVKTVYGGKITHLSHEKNMMQMNSHDSFFLFGQIYVVHDKSSE